MFTLEESEPWTLMPCAEYEDQILDLQHGQLNASARHAVEEHLAGCMACRHFAEDLKALDAALSARFQHAELPASFKAGLLRRIDAEAPRLSRELVASRKQALESEYQAASANLLKRVLRDRFGSVLDGFGLLGIALAIAFVAEQLLHRGPDFSKLVQGPLSQPTALYAAWATGALCVLGAIWFGLRQNGRRLIGRL
jgi:anti-sigma factor RsiW